MPRYQPFTWQKHIKAWSGRPANQKICQTAMTNLQNKHPKIWQMLQNIQDGEDFVAQNLPSGCEEDVFFAFVELAMTGKLAFEASESYLHGFLQEFHGEIFFYISYKLFSDAIFTFFKKELPEKKDEKDVEDLTAKTFAEIWKKVFVGEKIENVFASLFDIAKKRRADHFRKNMRRDANALEISTVPEPPSQEPTPLQAAEEKEEKQIKKEFLRTLDKTVDEEIRKILMLLQQGYCRKEIAKKLKISLTKITNKLQEVRHLYSIFLKKHE